MDHCEINTLYAMASTKIPRSRSYLQQDWCKIPCLCTLTPHGESTSINSGMAHENEVTHWVFWKFMTYPTPPFSTDWTLVMVVWGFHTFICIIPMINWVTITPLSAPSGPYSQVCLTVVFAQRTYIISKTEDGISVLIPDSTSHTNRWTFGLLKELAHMFPSCSQIPLN